MHSIEVFIFLQYSSNICWYRKGVESTYNFNFDKIFPQGTAQKDVYQYAAKPVVDGKHIVLVFSLI